MANNKNPLWLPKGSIRAFLALSILLPYVYLCFIMENLETLGIIAIIIIKEYFESKSK